MPSATSWGRNGGGKNPRQNVGVDPVIHQDPPVDYAAYYRDSHPLPRVSDRRCEFVVQNSNRQRKLELTLTFLGSVRNRRLTSASLISKTAATKDFEPQMDTDDTLDLYAVSVSIRVDL